MTYMYCFLSLVVWLFAYIYFSLILFFPRALFQSSGPHMERLRYV